MIINDRNNRQASWNSIHHKIGGTIQKEKTNTNKSGDFEERLLLKCFHKV